MSFEDNLDRLAALCVRFGLNLKQGQELILTAPIEAADLVRRITAEAYRAGAKNVIPFFADDAATLARFEHGPEAAFDYAPKWLYAAMGEALKNGAARLAISGNTPGLLAGQDPGKVARATRAQSVAYRPFLDAITSGATNWNIIPFVTPGWARQVFPGLSEADAVARLWALIFQATRLDRSDPVAAWEENFATLYHRRDHLQALNLSALHFEGGGTDLTVGLAKGHKWVGGGMALADGTPYAPNLPTEEIFSMPDRARVEGRAVFTKPAVIAGSIVEGLVVTFKDGKAVEIDADRNADIARSHFTTDEGASRLGEVALVPQSSPIARSGVLYFNTLFDENAASHIAFGNAYAMNLLPGVDPKAAGMNESQIHMDCMIGSQSVSVTGIGVNGHRYPVMESGEFVI
jgi:aminopeptidase